MIKGSDSAPMEIVQQMLQKVGNLDNVKYNILGMLPGSKVEKGHKQHEDMLSPGMQIRFVAPQSM